jgi:hypothetical protein
MVVPYTNSYKMADYWEKLRLLDIHQYGGALSLRLGDFIFLLKKSGLSFAP